MSWRARAVFVSGTFRDMHAERDLLGDQAFPALEEQLAQYFTTLERVDLRVGVETRGLADDHAKQALVLKVCLEDVKRCRPFLIVLVGDRYGWVPPIERSLAAATEAGFRETLEGKSVTALEIEYGLWGDSDQQTRSRIYFRQLDYTGMDEAHAIVFSDERAAVSPLVSAEEHAKAAERGAALAAAKRRLRTDPVMGPRCRNYTAGWDPAANKVTGLGTFVADVIGDLLPDMVAEAKEQVAAARAGTLPTPLEQFVAERARGFRGRAGVVARLVAHATDPTETDVRGVVVAGPSGGGKSAVFARVFEELSASSGDDVWLLAHAAGIDPRSTSVASLLEDWVAVLAGKLGIANPLALPAAGAGALGSITATGTDQRPKPDEVFAELVARAAAKKRVVLLLDALDRFERTPQAEHVTWLPPRLPVNVRLVATAVTGPESAALARRPDVVVETLDALTTDEAREIATSVYGRYHREPNQDAVGQLVATLTTDGARAHGSALWLVSALEELNLLDGDDFQRAEAGTDGTDEDRLHAMVVGEARALPGDVEALYARIFERAGRRVSDDPREGSALTRAFTTAIALSRRGFRERDLATLVPVVATLLDPSAPALTWNALSFASLRRALRAHLVRRGEDDRWDFHHRQARAAAEHANVPNAQVRMQIHTRVVDHLLGLDHLPGLPANDGLREGEAMYHLLQSGDLARAARHYASDLPAAALEAATQTLASAIVEQDPGTPLADALLAAPGLSDEVIGRASHLLLFELSDALSNASLARQSDVARAAGGQLQRLAAADPGNAGGQRELAVSHIKLGDVLMAQGNLLGAGAAFQASHGILERLAASDPGNAGWPRDLSVSHNKIGDVRTAQGNLPGALAAFQASLAIAEQLAAADPSNVGWQHDLAVSHFKIGDVLREQGNLPGAFAALRASIAIVEQLAAADLGNTRWQRDLAASHIGLGDVLTAQRNLAGALAAFQASFAIQERLAAADPSNASWQRDLSISHDRLGRVLTAQGNLPGALAAFQANLAIAERLAAADAGNADWQHDLAASHIKLGDVLTAQGNLPGALAAFQANLTIRERLAAADPGNAGWQRDLVVSNRMLARHLNRLQDPEAANYWRDCHNILRRMKARGMFLDPPLAALLEQLDRHVP